MYLKNMSMLFVSLGVGYALCVLAKKQTGVLKTLGYTLGISILALSLSYSLVASCPKLSSLCGEGGRFSKICSPMSKYCPMSK